MITINEFSFWYPGVDNPALDNVSLSINEGETVLIIGPSGCGKSTLLLSMNGVVPSLTGGKVKGRVFIDGHDTRTTPVASLAANVGLILQDPESQLTNLYVYDEVAFGPENLVLPEEDIIARTDQALEKSGLSDLKERSVFALSGGQKQRVAIAASLAMLPKIILLDNPTSNLDPVGAADTYRAIRELREDDPKKIIVLADHRPDHVISIVDRIIVMNEGKIITDGPPRKIFSQKGDYLKNELGIFLPQMVDLMLQIREKGYPVNPVPLSFEETAAVVSSLDVRILPGEGIKEGVDEAEKPSDAEPILDLEDVQFSYPNGVCAVDGVSLKIKQGEFLCLVGQNGSGKTTLAKLMVGLLNVSGGKIKFQNKHINEIPLRDLVGRVGYVFQYPEHQFVSHNVFDEIAFSPRAMNIDEKEVLLRTEKMLELFSLQDMRSASPLLLSKGQKRRLSVATMLITKPEVLILDEPMTGQDQKNITNLLMILNEMRAEGTTIIDITHDMEHVASYADRVVGMAKGKVIFDGSPIDLFVNYPALEKLYLESPPVVSLAEVLRDRGKAVPLCVNTITRMMQVIQEREES